MKFKEKDLHESGRPLTQEQFIERIKTDDEFAKTWGELGPIYGKQWRRWSIYPNIKGEYESNPIDQIANLINELKANPDSRRLMVTAWNPADLPHQVLPPCHYGFQVWTRPTTRLEKIVTPGKYRAISLMFNMRSNDVPLGLPFNIASYGLLLEIIAKMVNMVPDELIVNLGDAHIYLNQLEGIKEQLTREPYPLPKLNINTEWWPRESGECGIGPIDTQAVLNGFLDDNFCKCLIEDDIQLSGYKHHPTIKMPLSN